MKLGIDIGSTTVKLVLLDESDNIVYKKYERHMSNVFDKVKELLSDLSQNFDITEEVSVCITGSGGLSLATLIGVAFEQEVIAAGEAIIKYIPDTDVAIELGGEDAKITFYGNTVEQRMNGTCAGGTGAFIDQMAVLLNTDASGLNELAKKYKTIYPIAARCGVFAKTDIQPLINEGASGEDLSASIFQAVVNQTISGLACGRVIKGNVAFLGGPLSFLSELKKRFIETLELEEEQIVSPDNGEYFVALGAALLSVKKNTFSIKELVDKMNSANPENMAQAKHLSPLFKNREEYRLFKERHDKEKIERADIAIAKGKAFLGIDAGSTTTKAALIDDNKRLLYSFYKNNEGDPIKSVIKMLRELYEIMPEGLVIGRTTVTGYGEGLIKAAFKADSGEIETMAHYRAAEQFLPGVEFILDIGGQDMKCMKIKDGAIYNIMLNEACSSGCGSFIETYAKSVNMKIEDFANEALFAESPVDLGTRCTVFMNSKVKQSQKEGATIGEISAGLSYSVIKNALYKVIKLRNTDEAGEKIVVQGGTFLNDAVLKSVESILGKEVVRPDITGLMGAYGAAIVAMNQYREGEVSNIISCRELDGFSVESTHTRCKKCENNCMLIINTFADKSRFVTGNRCERGAGKDRTSTDVPNLYAYKYKRLFNYESLKKNEASRGEIGIPRVLNMYENYPFWHTFFTELKFRVVLSPQSSKNIYESGMETISSDTACYPAKLVHGHIKWLAKNGVKTIFYPGINYEIKENDNVNNHYNCPIVATYPEVIAGNMNDVFKECNVEFIHNFIPYDNDKKMIKALSKIFEMRGISYGEVKKAVVKARAEDIKFKSEIREKGLETVKYIQEKGLKGIVLAGRPYHLDPEINHGMDLLLNSFGFAVLTEDSVEWLCKTETKLRVLDQWTYHSRLYRAAKYVGTLDNVELIQLNSFGCGLDAVTTDQVEEILRMKNKLYTVLKIDEGSNLGAAKIRIRSLKAAMEERDKNNIHCIPEDHDYERKIFTKEMKEKYTILIPQMSPIHFDMVESALKYSGYNVELLPSVDKNAVDEGLRYINNDACYPTIVSLGQIISALKSGKYDLDKTAVFMSQTGGGCRASNYVALLRKAFKDLNISQVPVVSANIVGLENNPGFKITLSLAKRIIMGMVYGDLFMRVLYQTRPYEREKGSADRLHKKWLKSAKENVASGSMSEFKRNINNIVKDFDSLPLQNIQKPRVGVVGEILVKYHPTANNDIVGIIEREGGEAVVLDLLDFFLYGMHSKEFNYKFLSGKWSQLMANKFAIKVIEHYRKPARRALQNSRRFHEPLHIENLAEKASKVTSLGNQCGEGWLLTGEMVELLDGGIHNIVCLQPFACLPNHITGKGMMKPLRNYNPDANICAIDYDPGASDVNQLNRIKLMMATAHRKMSKT